ncbi:heavy metal translocating P-type ATPase [Eilatimonas milleporae]|uniref:Cu2+-exporting ATPase n=1 Tax=Eilatimonas milleporae TaxID=911205 RepID=A0A3M0CVT6_9PROT|nr:heavy metal translocating P-type ATPase [Eilatimonas milleporae]RMB07763.1 Cu2+-exporting ATPase [Eilatimonas milleporae]
MSDAVLPSPDHQPQTGHHPYLKLRKGGLAEAELLVPTMHCAGCMAKIERGLAADSDIEGARVNLSTKRVSIVFDPRRLSLDDLLARMKGIGFEASPFNITVADAARDRTSRRLLIAMAVAGFASANIMLFSVSVWDGSEMDAATRGLFHWISAVIAVAGVAIAGQPFFTSALAALRARALNMDVPISLAVLLSLGLSLYETVRGGDQVYFEAGVMLLFFLLIGRFLSERMRARASDAAQNLLALKAVPATIVGDGGDTRTVPAESLAPGQQVLVATGMRIPVDGTVTDGTSEVDASLVTGETLPEAVAPGARVFAGTLNVSAPLTVRVTGRGDDTLLAEIVRLMEAAEQARGSFVRLADRLARAYAPGVHLLALATFLGWWWAADLHLGLVRAIAVLIITCPCALGLAVPVVHVVAAGRLMKAGILMKSDDGLEKLADVDTVVFDKTGTLTLGELTLMNRAACTDDDLLLAAGLGMTSRHPLAQAVARAAGGRRLPMFDTVEEVTGAGLIGRLDGSTVRLGSRVHVGLDAAPDTVPSENTVPRPELWLRIDDGDPVRFDFADEIRPDAAATVAALKDAGKRVMLLSGDREAVVRDVAAAVGIDDWQAACRPGDKIIALDALKAAGARVLMVGDGLNDAPALRAAHVSLSPASASDITQTAADFIFQGRSLAAVTALLAIARRTRARVLENFALALGYNLLAVPLAVAGYVTPLVAAVAMSSSSLLVTGNALRLRLAATPDTSDKGTSGKDTLAGDHGTAGS